MKFIETDLPGAFVVELERIEDERGFFARAFCVKEFEASGLNPVVAQTNISFNRTRGTLRGMHFQTPPAAESKLIRCTRGSMYDVIVDLRADSRTYLQHFAAELSERNDKALYVPPMFGHGFQTLEDNTEVTYQMGEFFAPDCARGFSCRDPAIGIAWPLEVSVISEKDKNLPPFCDST